MNLKAEDEMVNSFMKSEIIFIKRGGENQSSNFGLDLAGITIFVIDVAIGDKIP